MRLQNNQEVYIAIEEKEILPEGSIKLYENVLNECVRKGTVDTLVRDYLLEEYKSFKLILRTRSEIFNFAESLQQKFNQWKLSEREIALKSLISARGRRNALIWLVVLVLHLGTGVMTRPHDNPDSDTPISWLSWTLITTGVINAVLWARARCITTDSRGYFDSEAAEKNMLACIKNRLSRNLDKEYFYSIFSSKNLIKDNELKGFLNSEAGKIENIDQIVTGYL